MRNTPLKGMMNKFSTQGYKKNSPDVGNKSNLIPSGDITMKGVEFPVKGTDNLGNTKIMQPGKDYKFPGSSVLETPKQQNILKNYKQWLETIESTPDLDGCGPILAPIFKKLLSGRKFGTAFEWCAGPAWIGMWLLENGICETLITGDINEKSVKFVRNTAVKNNYNVRAYISDNLKKIPKHEKFDLVISNPPNYSNIQRSHAIGYLRDDLRPSDIDWKIHEDFYNNISSYLNDDAIMFISEVEPYSKNVYFMDQLYDKRDEIPMKVFKKMTKKNNLKITSTTPYKIEDTNCYILEIQKFNQI